MAGGWGAYIQSMVSPQTGPGSAAANSGASLGEFGRMMQEKKQQDRYFNQQKQMIEDKGRSEALGRLQEALQHPDDKMELQSAVSEAKRFGVEVFGLDQFIAGEAERAAQPVVEPPPDAAPTPPPPAGKSNAPAWLDKYMADQNKDEGVSVDAETLQPTPDAPIVDQEALDNANELEKLQGATSEGTLSPAPVKVRSSAMLGIPDQLPPSGKGELQIKVNGRPYASVSLDELHGYRAKQAALVAHVFQPLIDQAGSDDDKKAASIAQGQAVEAYNSGMSKDKAIEFGNGVWKQLIGMRFKRDYNKFPPGFKLATPGGGGGMKMMTEKQSLDYADKLQDNDRQWLSEANKDFKFSGAQQAMADAGLVEEATHASTPMAQNQALMRILKEMSGSAVTNTEAGRFYEGIGIAGQAQLLLRRVEGGDITDDVRNGMREIAGLVRQRAQGQIKQAGDFLYNQVMTDANSPETDEQRLYHARRMRALATGESIEPMKKTKGGKLEPVQTSDEVPQPKTKAKNATDKKILDVYGGE